MHFIRKNRYKFLQLTCQWSSVLFGFLLAHFHIKNNKKKVFTIIAFIYCIVSVNVVRLFPLFIFISDWIHWGDDDDELIALVQSIDTFRFNLKSKKQPFTI